MKETGHGQYERQLLQAMDCLEAARLRGDLETPIEVFMIGVTNEHRSRVRKVLGQVDLDLRGYIPTTEEEANELERKFA